MEYRLFISDEGIIITNGWYSEKEHLLNVIYSEEQGLSGIGKDNVDLVEILDNNLLFILFGVDKTK